MVKGDCNEKKTRMQNFIIFIIFMILFYIFIRNYYSIEKIFYKKTETLVLDIYKESSSILLCSNIQEIENKKLNIIELDKKLNSIESNEKTANAKVYLEKMIVFSIESLKLQEDRINYKNNIEINDITNKLNLIKDNMYKYMECVDNSNFNFYNFNFLINWLK